MHGIVCWWFPRGLGPLTLTPRSNRVANCPPKIEKHHVPPDDSLFSVAVYDAGLGRRPAPGEEGGPVQSHPFPPRRSPLPLKTIARALLAAALGVLAALALTTTGGGGAGVATAGTVTTGTTTVEEFLRATGMPETQ